MPFYHNIITEKSFLYLQELKRKYKFILIGGWAVFLYSKNLKSKDIDIIVEYNELAKIKENFKLLYKNDRLRKYEISKGNFDIDIYVPHYSELGISIEEIQKTAVNKEGFIVPSVEILFLLKLFAWHNRCGSTKGQKDELDIFSLAMLLEFDWKKYLQFINKFNFYEYHKNFIHLLKNAKNIKELGVNEQKLSKVKKEIFRKLSLSY